MTNSAEWISKGLQENPFQNRRTFVEINVRPVLVLSRSQMVRARGYIVVCVHLACRERAVRDPLSGGNMAGGQGNRTRRAGPAVGLAVLCLALGATAGAQVPGPTGPAPPADALAQIPTPRLSPAGMPAAGFAEIADSMDPPVVMPGPTTVPRAWSNPGPVAAPTAARMGLGIFDTITESVFGQPDPDSWRPLPFSTLFSEGWSEAWVPSPKGSGGAPRQGWINAVAGNLYRGWFFTFAQGFNDPPKGNAYLGSYTLMTPLSRRLMLITNIPFVLRNNAERRSMTRRCSATSPTTSRPW